MMVSIVIPAFDEAATIGCCVKEALNCCEASEVIVVDDGSADGTADAAEAAGAKVIRHARNAGKAAAMNTGVRAASHDVILFMDADVTGYTAAKLSSIVQPVMNGQFEMFVGIRARKTLWLNRLLHFFPIIGGERAVTRRLWESVPKCYQEGFKIEIALNNSSKKFGRGMGFQLIAGTHHHIKEKKYGLVRGFVRRLAMIAEVLMVSVQIYIRDPATNWLRRGVLTVRQWLQSG
jgi:polyprenyl-phospho-N-acetylgalactosaminyl synthase